LFLFLAFFILAFCFNIDFLGKLGELPARRALNFLSGHLSGELDML